MDFGKVTPAELEKIKFKLPPDHLQTTRVLSTSKRKGGAHVVVGCAKWGRPDWVGKIYPKGTKPANFLDEYAKQFNAIEYNAIFYKLPTIEEVEKYKSKVGKDFLFFPKFQEAITHRKRLKNVQAELDEFWKVYAQFGKNAGPVFFMPHPQMNPTKNLDTIHEFIGAIPKDIPLFVEFRHPDWYKAPYVDAMYEWLEKNKKGSIITDSAGRRDCVHMRLTTPDAFIRFVGNSLHASDYKRIDQWVDRIVEWDEQGLQNCYFFMHQHEELYSPELCKYLIERLNKKGGYNIPVPKFAAGAKLF
jgi:uncharacterized protein YecE (DUF72 family)